MHHCACFAVVPFIFSTSRMTTSTNRAWSVRQTARRLAELGQCRPDKQSKRLFYLIPLSQTPMIRMMFRRQVISLFLQAHGFNIFSRNNPMNMFSLSGGGGHMTLIHAQNPVYICMCTHIEKYISSLYDLPRLQLCKHA